MRLLALALLLAASAASAQDRAEWNPPARYDHAYRGELTVIYAPQQRVKAMCHRALARFGIASTPTQRGCATRSGNSCTVIVIDKPYRGTSPAAALRHETGHCNGWSGHHPD